MLGMVTLVGLGEQMIRRFLPLYLTALGGGILSVGLLGGMDNLLSAFYSFPGGYLSDRWGHKKALVFFNLLTSVGYLIALAFPAWQTALLGAALFLAWTSISVPAAMSLITQNLHLSQRTRGVSYHSLVRRIPMILGPLAGGLLVTRFGEVQGLRLAFGAALALCLASLALQMKLMRAAEPDLKAEHRPWKVWPLFSPRLKSLLVSDILIRFCEQIPNAFVVIWCVRNWGLSAQAFGWLTAVEMGTAMAIYLPVAGLADRGTKRPYVIATFAFFSVFPLALFFSHSFGALLLAFVLRGLKEFGEPARKALILDLAPPDRKASAFGLYYLLRDSVVSLAAFAGAFLWRLSPAANLFTAFGFGLAGMAFYVWMGKDRTFKEEA
jgi:MFS family permease